MKKTNQTSHYCLCSLYSLLLFIGLLSLSTASHAKVENLTVEQTFELLESGKPQDQAAIDKHLEFLKSNIDASTPENYRRLQRALCWAHDMTDPDSLKQGVKFADTQLSSNLIIQSPEAVIDLKLCKAWLNQNLNNIDAALTGYNDVILAAYKAETPRLIADARSLRGRMFSFQGNFGQALEDLITAQGLYDSLNLEYWSLYNLSDIATSYRRFGDPQTAIKHYKKLEQKYKAMGDLDGAIAMTTEMAIALEELQQYQQALDTYMKAYDYWETKDDQLGKSLVAVNLTGTLIKLNQIPQAKQFLAQAKPHVEPKFGAFYSYLNLFEAEIALLDKQPEAALASIEEAQHSFETINNQRGLAQLYQVKTQIYKAQNDTDNALAALEQYLIIHNELDAKQQTNLTTEMRTRFNTERIEDENQQLLQLQKIKEHELQIYEQNRLLQLAVIIMGFLLMLVVSVFAYKQTKRSKKMSSLAMTDHLTQLPNRRHTYKQGEAYFKQLPSSGQQLSLILFDVDNFKKINDQFGHDIGDKALMGMANISVALMRENDLVGRVGGEEFLVLLPNTNAQQALLVAQRLIQSIAKTAITDISDDFYLTASAGVATQQSETDFSALLQNADNALYQAKSNGKNCAVLYRHTED
ncbi:diguanylate cyclase [Shewanella waksmanii]|uniref:tetratricopeptide repeat-containing diguanylate cyclase n=1 Tax=Shewanella waksmanii TaxID=213783 RepID=UPI00373613EC